MRLMITFDRPFLSQVNFTFNLALNSSRKYDRLNVSWILGKLSLLFIYDEYERLSTLSYALTQYILLAIQIALFKHIISLCIWVWFFFNFV